MAWRQIAATARREEDYAALATIISTRADDPATAEGAAILAGEWAQKNPADAVPWVLSLPPGSVRQAAFRDLAGNWGGVDAAEIARLREQADDTSAWEATVAAQALLAAGDNHQTALRRAAAIPDPALREHTLRRLASPR